MAETAFTTLYDEVVPELTGAVALPLVLNAIRQAARDFCMRSFVWRVDQGPMAVAQNANEYDWEPPTNTEAVRPMQVWLEKRPLTPRTANELSEMFGDFMRAEGTPSYFVADRPDKLVIVPKPTGVYTTGITAKLAVMPSQAATGMETIYATRYRDAIGYGAKARLFRMPRKPWTDKQAASDYQAMFDAAVNTAQLEASRGFGGARARVRPMYF